MKTKTWIINREGRATVIEETTNGNTHWKDMRLATEDDLSNIPLHPVWGYNILLCARPEDLVPQTKPKTRKANNERRPKINLQTI